MFIGLQGRRFKPLGESMERLLTFRIKLIIAFASLYILWGSTYLAIRWGVETIPPFLMAGARHLSAGLFLYFIMRRRLNAAVTPKQWRSAWILGALMLVGGNGGVTWAEQRVPSGLAALLVATVPLWVMIMSWLQKDVSKPGMREWAGVILGFFGLGILVGPEELAGGERVDEMGAAVLFMAALSWAIGSLYSRQAPLTDSPFLNTAMQMIAGGVLLFILGFASGEWNRLDIAQITWRSFLSWGYLAVFGSLVGFSAYIWLLKVSTPSKVTTYAYVNPVVAVFFGWALAGEELSARTLLASAVIISSVVIITLPKKFNGWRSVFNPKTPVEP